MLVYAIYVIARLERSRQLQAAAGDRDGILPPPVRIPATSTGGGPRRRHGACETAVGPCCIRRIARPRATAAASRCQRPGVDALPRQPRPRRTPSAHRHRSVRHQHQRRRPHRFAAGLGEIDGQLLGLRHPVPGPLFDVGGTLRQITARIAPGMHAQDRQQVPGARGADNQIDHPDSMPGQVRIRRRSGQSPWAAERPRFPQVTVSIPLNSNGVRDDRSCPVVLRVHAAAVRPRASAVHAAPSSRSCRSRRPDRLAPHESRPGVVTGEVGAGKPYEASAHVAVAEIIATD